MYSKKYAKQLIKALIVIGIAIATTGVTYLNNRVVNKQSAESVKAHAGKAAALLSIASPEVSSFAPKDSLYSALEQDGEIIKPNTLPTEGSNNKQSLLLAMIYDENSSAEPSPYRSLPSLNSDQDLMDELNRRESQLIERLVTDKKTLTKKEQELIKSDQKLIEQADQKIDSRIPEKTVTLTRDVLADCSIEPESLLIQFFDDREYPASSDDSGLYVNPSLLNQFSDAAQRFIIAHEIAHYLFHDSARSSVIRWMLSKQNDNSKEETMITLLRLYETRADLFALSLGQPYIQGGIDFVKMILEKFSEHEGPTHPKNGTRLAFAQSYLNNQSTLSAKN